MSKNSEIPCSACHNWDAKTKSLSCNPYKCQQLSEWFFGYKFSILLKNSKNAGVKPLVIVYLTDQMPEGLATNLFRHSIRRGSSLNKSFI